MVSNADLNNHIYNFHVSTIQMGNAAILSGYITAAEVNVLDSQLQRGIAEEAAGQLRLLSQIYHQLEHLALTDTAGWLASPGAATISADAKLPAFLKDRSGRATIESSSSLIVPVNENMKIQPWVNPNIPLHNLGHEKQHLTNSVQVVINDKGEVRCSLQSCACGEFFQSY